MSNAIMFVGDINFWSHDVMYSPKTYLLTFHESERIDWRT